MKCLREEKHEDFEASETILKEHVKEHLKADPKAIRTAAKVLRKKASVQHSSPYYLIPKEPPAETIKAIAIERLTENTLLAIIMKIL